MTREEAIEILWRYDVNFEPHPPEEVMHAIDMAIEALEGKDTNVPTKDCISRQDVYHILEKAMIDRPLDSDRWVIRDIGKAIRSLPSADRPTGECRTCGRNADNGGVHEDGRTKCPIQEHYALLLDGYCHLYEPYDCGAKMRGEEE